jgi:glyceraldehyde 3-phosphate dehydrogenase
VPAAELNAVLAARAADGDLEGILQVTHEPFVSSDVVKSPFSAVVDAGLTDVTGGTQAKVVAWYDNEWGYATRLVELAQLVAVTPLALVRS